MIEKRAEGRNGTTLLLRKKNCFAVHIYSGPVACHAPSPVCQLSCHVPTSIGETGKPFFSPTALSICKSHTLEVSFRESSCENKPQFCLGEAHAYYVPLYHTQGHALQKAYKVETGKSCCDRATRQFVFADSESESTGSYLCNKHNPVICRAVKN